MSAEVGCDGDISSNSNGFSNIERMRFRTLTYEIIEELRMRRDQDVENERKIQILLQDKFELGKKLDVELAKLVSKEEQHDAELRETRRQMEDKIREFKIDASQQQVARKIADKENDALKDEIRKLQLSNYALQKQIRDHERHEKVQATEREQHIRQMSQFENQFKQVTSLMKDVANKQMKLEKDMKEVQHLNHLLRYQNHHHRCVLKLKNADISRLQGQIVTSGLNEKVSARGDNDKETELTREITLLKEKLATTQKQFTDLSDDCESWKNKYWDSLKTLAEAHRLVNVNLHNAAQYKEECEAAEGETRKTAEKLEQTEADLKDVTEKLDSLRVERDQASEEWMNKKAELEDQIQEISDELASQREQYSDLEAINTQAKEENDQLTTELEQLKAVLNRERSEYSSQTELSLLCMIDMGVQADIDLADKEVQTDPKNISVCYVQTINPAMYSSGVQTDKPEVELTASHAQTEVHESVSIEVQTDRTEEDASQKSKQQSEMSAKCLQTDTTELVHEFVQTDSGEDNQVSTLPTELGPNLRQNESQSDFEVKSHSEPYYDYRTKNMTNQSLSGQSSSYSYNKTAVHYIGQSTTRSNFQETNIEVLDLDVGISAKDLKLNLEGRKMKNNVEVDPKDYALNLTPQVVKDEPVKSLVTDKSDTDVMENVIGQAHETDDVTTVVIGDSDEDDVVESSQLSHKFGQGDENKLEMQQGRVKHKLSLTERQRKFRQESPRDTETDCSAAKQFKYTVDDSGVDNTSANESDGNNEHIYQNLPVTVPMELNRLVARSGQAQETSFTTHKMDTQSQNQAIRIESFVQQRNKANPVSSVPSIDPGSTPVTPVSLSSGETSAERTFAVSSTKPPEEKTSEGEPEPSFLQKYREIVSKIKPVANPQRDLLDTVQPVYKDHSWESENMVSVHRWSFIRRSTKRSSARKGKQLYSNSLTATMLPPSTATSVSEETASQYSVDCLTTPKGSLRGILKGGPNKEKGNKSVSWNS